MVWYAGLGTRGTRKEEKGWGEKDTKKEGADPGRLLQRAVS
jgi:hypothetical protein